jgi:hypothetical protein
MGEPLKRAAPDFLGTAFQRTDANEVSIASIKYRQEIEALRKLIAWQ